MQEFASLKKTIEEQRLTIESQKVQLADIARNSPVRDYLDYVCDLDLPNHVISGT